MKKTVAIIQARMGSTRLPGKVLMRLHGRTVLNHVIDRVKQSKLVDEIIIATTTLNEDDILAEEASQYGVHIFRGSSDNVLNRYYEAAKEAKADVIVRITSDCPLIDPIVIDQVVEIFQSRMCHIATNVGTNLADRTFPRGLDVEVFSFEALSRANANASQEYEWEHVTPFIYEYYKEITCYTYNKDYSKYRWTVDTKEDFELIYEIYNRLYKGQHNFYLSDVIELFAKEPRLFKINQHIEQKVIK